MEGENLHSSFYCEFLHQLKGRVFLPLAVLQADSAVWCCRGPLYSQLTRAAVTFSVNVTVLNVLKDICLYVCISRHSVLLCVHIDTIHTHSEHAEMHAHSV